MDRGAGPKLNKMRDEMRLLEAIAEYIAAHVGHNRALPTLLYGSLCWSLTEQEEI
jgi:hypothetical protein